MLIKHAIDHSSMKKSYENWYQQSNYIYVHDDKRQLII